MSKKLTIAEMKSLAAKRGGKCLSTKYVGNHLKLKWQCFKGHTWEAVPRSVKFGRWCRKCANSESGKSRRLTIEEMRQVAKKRGGKCLSTKYVGNHSKLKWQCSEGHTWEALPYSVKQGRWCKKCAYSKSGKSRRLTIEEMRQIAEMRGGKCLSDNYSGNKQALLWQCSEGHTWEAKPSDVNQGTWCKYCSSGLGERICREYFEQLFGKPFRKAYPTWLVNKKNNRMELDGYNSELHIAFEHHGEQHYSLKTPYITTKEDLRSRQKDDALKRKLCEERGICLIEIPEVPTRLAIHKLKEYIRSKCELNYITLPDDFDTSEVYLFKVYTTPDAKIEMELLRKLAAKRGGKCLSEKYISSGTKLRWQCANGHEWEAVPANVKKGAWCSNCYHSESGNSRRLTIEEMSQIAEMRGGKCLSKEYVNANSKLKWQCSKGHTWEAVPGSVKFGRWCRKCANSESGNSRRLTIEEMRQIAEMRGGKCLSKEYVNANSKLKWQCSEGHTWEAEPSSVKQGRWCSKCYHSELGKSRRLTIEEMRQVAKKRGGKCLSKEYVNANSKLKWQCSEGHTWEAVPYSVKQGHWCKKCYDLLRSG